jgi:hypothetical protein
MKLSASDYLLPYFQNSFLKLSTRQHTFVSSINIHEHSIRKEYVENVSIFQRAVTPSDYYCYSGKISTTFKVGLRQFGEYIQFRYNA